MPKLASALVAEMIGTFALCFIGIMSINQLGGVANNGGLVGIALAHGLILAILITATAAISGGHLNPAVTLGLLVIGKIKPGPAAAYIVSQLLGGVLAGFAVMAIAKSAGVLDVTNGTPTVDADKITLLGACLAEGIATFFLMTAVLGTAVDPRAPKIGGFGIGLSVTAGILAIGPLTGAALNPARAIGPALAATIAGAPGEWSSHWWSVHWIYWIGPIGGGILAAIIYKGFFAPDANS